MDSLGDKHHQAMNQTHPSQLRGKEFKSTTFRNPFDKANSSLSPPLLPSPVRRYQCSPGSGDSLVAVPVPSGNFVELPIQA